MFNVFLGSTISIGDSLHTIPWEWPFLLIWFKRINLFPRSWNWKCLLIFESLFHNAPLLIHVDWD
jgi:hypothetical protein